MALVDEIWRAGSDEEALHCLRRCLEAELASGGPEAVKLLVAPPLENGTTPLSVAVKKGFAGCVSLLCDEGADFLVTTDNGTTLLHLAAERGDAGVVRALLRYFDNPNQVRHDGRNAVHLAAIRNHDNVIREFRNFGAHQALNWRDADGRTPADWARGLGNRAALCALDAKPPSPLPIVEGAAAGCAATALGAVAFAGSGLGLGSCGPRGTTCGESVIALVGGAASAVSSGALLALGLMLRPTPPLLPFRCDTALAVGALPAGFTGAALLGAGGALLRHAQHDDSASAVANTVGMALTVAGAGLTVGAVVGHAVRRRLGQPAYSPPAATQDFIISNRPPPLLQPAPTAGDPSPLPPEPPVALPPASVPQITISIPSTPSSSPLQSFGSTPPNTRAPSPTQRSSPRSNQIPSGGPSPSLGAPAPLVAPSQSSSHEMQPSA